MKKSIFCASLMVACATTFGQHDGGQPSGTDAGQIHGNTEANFQYYQADPKINAVPPKEQATLNAFTNLIYTKGKFSGGLRYESYLPAQLGYPDGFEGSGIGYRYAKYSDEMFEFTVGNFFEQFGSGLLFRAYEARGLGIDNAMDGLRLKFMPKDGIVITGIHGKQRKNFNDGFINGRGTVRGVDGNFAMNSIIDGWQEKKLQWNLGGSFVSKYEQDDNPDMELPENVGSWSGRMGLQYGKVSMEAEYAYKINDPSADNGNIYKPGHAYLLNLTYATKGFSASFDAKAVDNFSFRSERNEKLTVLMMNYLPALTKQHSYNLAATLYPYAAQPTGEMAYQGEISYKIPKKSKIGGKYGTQVTVNFAQATSMDSTSLHDLDMSDLNSPRLGYTSNLFGLGDDIYFQDFNVEIKRKINKKLKFVYMYLNMIMNNTISQLARDNNGVEVLGDIRSQIHVLESQIKFNRKNSLRVELQHLGTKQHQGNWATIVTEYTYSPHWFIAGLVQYNYGNYDPDFRIFYPYASVGYMNKASRLAIGYGKQRAGVFCIGGVCRTVPASNGLTVSFTTSF